MTMCKNTFRFLMTLVLVAAVCLSATFTSGCSSCAKQQTPQQNSQVQKPDSKSADSGQGQGEKSAPNPNTSQKSQPGITKNGSYTSKQDVALYIHTYRHLPSNYISKTKAKKAGWVPSKGNLWVVCPGKSIGGSRFYDDDGRLPYKKGRIWTECDIDYRGGARNAKRIVFSNDGLIYYTNNHYKTFERLY